MAPSSASSAAEGSELPRQDAAEIAGGWTLHVVSGQETIVGALEIEVTEDGLEGTFTRTDVTDAMPAALTGKVAEETLTFSFAMELPAGTRGNVEFVGEIGDRLLAGTFTTAAGISGEWTARRPGNG
jgi:hypothetical protein